MPSSRLFSPPFILGLGAGSIVGLILVLVLVRWMYGDPTPQFTFENYLVALERWNDEAPESYDIEVQVRGSQPATYYVQVRAGEARSAFRNGKFLPQKRSHETWSVDGMFGTLAQDVRRLEDAQQAGSGAPFNLRIAFDPRYGYPAHYHRTEYATPIEVEWDVLKFEPLSKDARWTEESPPSGE